MTHIVAEDIGGCKEELSQLNERRRGIGSKGRFVVKSKKNINCKGNCSGGSSLNMLRTKSKLLRVIVIVTVPKVLTR